MKGLLSWSLKEPFYRFDHIAPAVAAAGISLLGQGLNSLFTNSTNKQQMNFQREMYGRQRADSLQDWNTQNAYNDPAAQMARLKNAGLNAHLVYGNGATTLAQPMAPSTTPFASLKSPTVDFDKSIAAYQTGIMNKAQFDNIAANTDVAQTEKLLKAAQTAKTWAEASSATTDAEVKGSIKSYLVEAADLANQQTAAQTGNTMANTKATLSNAEQNVVSTTQNVAESVARIAKMRYEKESLEAGTALSKAQRSKTFQEIENLKKDSTLKQLEINLRRMGINPNDPTWQRLVAQVVSNIDFNSVKDGIKGIGKNIMDKKHRDSVKQESGDAYRKQFGDVKPFE